MAMVVVHVFAAFCLFFYCLPAIENLADARPSVECNTSNYWIGGVVPYMISDNFTAGERNVLRKQLKEIQHDAGECVQFRERQTNETDYVLFKKISFSACAATSGVGRLGGKQTVFLGPICFASDKNLGFTKHIILHVLGLPHEHQRFDRDKYVTINYGNVFPTMRSQFDKINDNTTLPVWTGFEYDLSSIMHFSSNEFSIKPGELTTITTKDAAKSELLSPDKPRTVSPIDRAKLRKLYCQSKSE